MIRRSKPRHCRPFPVCAGWQSLRREPCGCASCCSDSGSPRRVHPHSGPVWCLSSQLRSSLHPPTPCSRWLSRIVHRPQIPYLGISAQVRGYRWARHRKDWDCVSVKDGQPCADKPQPWQNVPCGCTTDRGHSDSGCRRGRGAGPPHNSPWATMWRGDIVPSAGPSGRVVRWS